MGSKMKGAPADWGPWCRADRLVPGPSEFLSRRMSFAQQGPEGTWWWRRWCSWEASRLA